VSASKLHDITRKALPNSTDLHSRIFGEEYVVKGPRIMGILLLLAKKTDSAGWL
jgi:hypothetical protein